MNNSKRFNNMELDSKKEYINSKIELIKNNLLWYTDKYHEYYNSSNKYDILFQEYILNTQRQITEITVYENWTDIKELKVDKLLDNLTEIYINVYNGLYNPFYDLSEQNIFKGLNKDL